MSNEMDSPAPEGEEREGASLEAILREAEDPSLAAVATWLDALTPIMRTPAVEGTPPAPSRFVFRIDDPPAHVHGIIAQVIGRRLGLQATWVRFEDQASGRDALFVINAPHPLDGADLMVIAAPGALTRGMIRDVCRWAFLGLGLSRIVVRIPVDRADLQDLARRAGFAFEGTARDLYGIGSDGQVWAMPGTRCRWLAPRAAPPAVDQDAFANINPRVQ